MRLAGSLLIQKVFFHMAFRLDLCLSCMRLRAKSQSTSVHEKLLDGIRPVLVSDVQTRNYRMFAEGRDKAVIAIVSLDRCR